MGWLIALAVIAAVAAVPLGFALRYDENGPLARLIIGPVRIKLYPRPKKEAKEKTEKQPVEPPKPAPAVKKPQTKSQTKSQTREPPKPEPTPAGGKIRDFLPLVKLAVDLLGDLRRKIRVNRLELKLTLAGEDPCDLAVHYGRAWAAVGNLLPRLERLFVIKNKDVEVQCDFCASETVIFARMDLSITLGRFLALAALYGIRAIQEFLKLRKKISMHHAKP